MANGGALLEELARALDLAQQLEAHLSRASSPPESYRCSTAAEILSAIQKSILMAQSSAPGSPPSDGASPLSESSAPEFRDQDRKGMMKKRKTLHKWTTRVRLNPSAAGGVEGTVDDGHSWRKYGQKDILGSKHPRAYYRCTYQNTQGCPAAKQVQRSDDDPLLFDVTYLGTHSCRQKPPKGSAPTPAHKEPKQSPNRLLLSFQSEMRVKTEALDSEEAPAAISSLIADWSPDFLESPYQVHSLDASDSDLTDIIGRANRESDSSFVDMDFLLDELDLEQSFQFDASVFFS
ncbi:probable WRKY transcription factor 41 [Zingiber officinale]|uniref:probable WRKY transcription factor 41 n=1 Tax=Zingiber officinale TaxID=94328 RepID=UPI001C4B8B3B|nr:probable WRKY transcription factor 41 [Zingiber officinale]